MPKLLTTSAKGFDRLAGVYDALMQWVFWGNIARSQICFLTHLPEKARVLVLGGGTGWIVREIWKVCPTANIVYVELSSKMLSKTQRRIPENKTHQVQLLLGDEQAVPEDSTFDVICTFFFLDLFPQKKAKEIVKYLNQFLKTEGLWLYADFEAKSKGSWLKKKFIRLMYLVCNCFCKLENTRYWHYPSVFYDLAYKEKATKTFFGELIRAYCYEKSK